MKPFKKIDHSQHNHFNLYRMGRGKKLTSDQIAVVKALHKEKKTVRLIAQAIERSPTAVQNIINKTRGERKKQKLGRPSSITPQFHRAIVRSVVPAPAERVTASTLVSTYRPKVGVRRVQQLMQEAANLQLKRMEKAPRLTDNHKKARLEWAKEMLHQSPSKWMHTIFSDEKRFCLDGPDGCAYYWTDKRIEPRHCSTRQKGGGGIMVWGAFSSAGTANLATIEGTLDSEGYCTILEECLLLFAEDKHPNGWRFQQDNALIHTSNCTKTFFTDTDIEVIDWPARSPDLNPIENLWGYLVQKVYKDFRQFDDIECLKEVIAFAWDSIDLEYLQKLARSMPRRCTEVIERKGGCTHY